MTAEVFQLEVCTQYLRVLKCTNGNIIVAVAVEVVRGNSLELPVGGEVGEGVGTSEQESVEAEKRNSALAGSSAHSSAG